MMKTKPRWPASAVKAAAGETGRQVASKAVQVLGGVGFTWEHDIHLYLKRALANETALGDPFYHREAIVRRLERG